MRIHPLPQESVDGGQCCRVEFLAGRPGVRHIEPFPQLATTAVHRAHDTASDPLVRQRVPDLFLLGMLTVAQVEVAMLRLLEPGVHGDPLDPRLEVLVALLGLRQNGRLVLLRTRPRSRIHRERRGQPIDEIVL